MTRVLMITNRFIYGGIEKLLLDIFKWEQNSSIQYDLLTLISEKDDDLIKQVESYGVHYYSLNLDKHSKLERQIYHYRALYKFVKEHHYDVVHINITSYIRVFDMLVVKLAGVKKRIIHSHSADKEETLLWRMIRPIKKIYDYVATDFFACSENAAKHLFSKSIFEKKRYVIVKNGIDIQEYLYSDSNRTEIRTSLGLDDETLLIGHVGRFTKAKNHKFILEVFHEIHRLKAKSKLLLVGDGELRQEIETQIHELGIEDDVMLYGSSSNVPNILSSMDVFLFPSKYEGFGLSVIEAECNGLPCYISENVPRTAAITSNVHQLAISDGAKKWAELIVCENNHRTNETAKIIENGFDISATVRQIERIYEE